MKNEESSIQLVKRVIEDTAYGSAPAKVAELSTNDLDNRFIFIRRGELPRVCPTGSHYLEAGEAKRVARNSDPYILREKAKGLLAIADERERIIEAENAELAPYRLQAMKDLHPNELSIDIYTYTNLSFNEKFAVDQIVDLRRYNDKLKEALEANGIEVDSVTE